MESMKRMSTPDMSRVDALGNFCAFAGIFPGICKEGVPVEFPLQALRFLFLLFDWQMVVLHRLLLV